MKTIAFGFLLFLSMPVVAWASSEYDSMYDECVKKNGPINNGVVSACSEMTSEKAKQEITRRYKSIYGQLSSENPMDAKKFEISQKAWLQYRNTHCELAGAYVGSPMYAFCPMTLNSARALELRELDGK
jgi:uncharacterized protein YecT (DUF1311 family)